MISIEGRLEKAHKGFAYELLELQMAVEDQRLGSAPSVIQITRLLQLYMIGVEVLESIGDVRYAYFNNKIHGLMMKKHVVKKLREFSGAGSQSPIKVEKAQLDTKRSEHESACYFNQGQVDFKKVKQIIDLASDKQQQIQTIIKSDLKKQEEMLEQRIKSRRMKSEAGSSKKMPQSMEFFSPENRRKMVTGSFIQSSTHADNQYDINFIDFSKLQTEMTTRNSLEMSSTLINKKLGLHKLVHGPTGSDDDGI